MHESYWFARRAAGLVLVLAFLFSAAGEAHAAGKTIYVKASATGLNNGSSWTNAFKSLQKALSAALPGDQIWVAKGTYKPTTSKNREISFRPPYSAKLYGGFAGNETALSQRNPAANITILSGDIGTPGVTADNSYHVVRGTGLTSLTVMDGFEITGGNANGPDASVWSKIGAGMLIDDASPVLRNLTFRLNSAASFGGGLAIWEGSNPRIIDTSFIGNSALAGGGIYLTYADTTLSNVTFSGNSASQVGGGMSNTQSSPTLVNVTFYGNSAGNAGGGMHNSGLSSAKLRHITMSGNTAPFAGGMANSADSLPIISNSIFWGNDATYGPEFYNGAGGSQSITDSIVQGGCPGGFCANVWDADPMLQPLKNNGGFTKTMALGADSAAIDAGGLNQPCATRDQRGVSRPQGGKCDVGAYEVRAKTFTSTAPQDGYVVEGGENTGVGSLTNSVVGVLAVGDAGDNSQVRSILSFNTAAVPDGASVVLARVQVRAATAPMLTLGTLLIDLKKPYFGTSANLQPVDFQARATVPSAGYLVPPVTGMLHAGTLNSSARLNINKSGLTQLRLRFAMDDDNDHVEDTLYVLSGESATAAERPKLIVYYNP